MNDPLSSINLLSGIVTLIMGAASAWLSFRKKLKTTASLIDQQKDDIARRDMTISKRESERDEWKKRCAALETQFPETVLEEAKKERAANNHDVADHVLRCWIESEGKMISEILYQRASWAEQHSKAPVRAAGLVVAETYATAAVVFWSQNQNALNLLIKLANDKEQEGQPSPFMVDALTEFASHPGELVNRNFMVEAAAANEEAWRQFECGHYDTALQIVEHSLNLLLENVGTHTVPMFKTQRLHAYILDALGRYDEALEEARGVVEAQEAHPAVGPSDPDTFESRYLVSTVLRKLDRSDEALEEARGIVEALEADPAFAPSHPNIPMCRSLIASSLHRLGRYEEALKEARAVVEAFEVHPAFGPSHLKTMGYRYLVAEILISLGRYEEALEEARAGVKAFEDDSAVGGPSHPDTLLRRQLVAQSLNGLGRHEEALKEARAVIEAFEAHPAFGPLHPNTLRTRFVVAYTLDKLGRYDEALKEAYAVTNEADKRRFTLRERYLIAYILHHLRRDDEALKEARAVLEAFKAHPAFGPSHPDTLLVRQLVAEILAELGDASS